MNMKKDKNLTENKKNNFLKKYYMFMILFIFVLAYFMLTKKANDDLDCLKDLVGRSLKDYLIYRYNNWSSRLIIDGMMIMLCKNVKYKVFCVLNAATYVVMTIIISKIFNKEQNKNINIFLCFLVLLYPLSHLGSAGYIATSINYLLPLTCLFYSMYVVLQIINNKKFSKISYIIAIITTLIACNMEQTCITFVALLFFIEIFSIIKKKNKVKF